MPVVVLMVAVLAAGCSGRQQPQGWQLSVAAGTERGVIPGPALSSGLYRPRAVAADARGNTFVIASNMVEKVTAKGVLSVVAGTGDEGKPTPGPARRSALSSPQGVAVDAHGDVFIADTGNDVVERVRPSGRLSIFAGNGRAGVTRPGPADSTPIASPLSVAVGSGGEVIIATGGGGGSGAGVGDYTNSAVLGVSRKGQLRAVAGDGIQGPVTPGRATTTHLGLPTGVAVDRSGNVYICDEFDERIEKVSPHGALSFVVGTGLIGRPKPGPVTGTRLSYPTDLTVNTAGDIYLSDEGAIYRIDQRKQMISLFAGRPETVPPTPGPLQEPAGLSANDQGTIVTADDESNRVDQIEPDGSVHPLAGIGPTAGSPTNGPGPENPIGDVSGLTLDASGSAVIDTSSNCDGCDSSMDLGLYALSAGHGLTALTRARAPSQYSGIAVVPGAGPIDLQMSTISADQTGNLYLATQGDGLYERAPKGLFHQITASPSILPIPPKPIELEGGGTVNIVTAPALRALFGLAVGPNGDIYVASLDTNEIEQVTPSGHVTVYAGNGMFGAPKPGPALRSPLRVGVGYPIGMAFDRQGDLYLTDPANNDVDKITPDGTLSVVAGTGRSGRPVPGPAIHSPLDEPQGVAVDHAGDVFIGDTVNNAIEEVHPDGQLTVIAGRRLEATTIAGPVPGPALASAVPRPGPMTIDSNGDLLVASTEGNSDILELRSPT